MRKKIFFDLDGTLIDSRQRLYQLFCSLVSENTLSFDAYWELKRSKSDHANILKNRFQWPDNLIAEFQNKWLDLIEQPEWLALDKVFDGGFQVLDRLQFTCDLYLFTARQSEQRALIQLHELRIADYFKKVFVTEQKVDKETLIQRSQLSIANSDIAIGDTGVDVNLAKNIGCISVAVTSGFRSKEVLQEYNPDYILSSICDPQLIEICLS
jgi:phosphoglycolate phosphatase